MSNRYGPVCMVHLTSSQVLLCVCETDPRRYPITVFQASSHSFMMLTITEINNFAVDVFLLIIIVLTSHALTHGREAS